MSNEINEGIEQAEKPKKKGDCLTPAATLAVLFLTAVVWLGRILLA